MQLRDYQIDIASRAAEIIRQHGLAYLCMEVRTGKTFTAFQVAANLGKKNVLFVTKKKAISSIDKDYDDFAKLYNFGVVLINFEQLHKIGPGFDLVIVDEAHSIGAFPRPSNRAKELRRICSNSCHVLYLSGTPSPESYSQFYHQLCITDYSPWNHYPTFYRWAMEYTTPASIFVYNRQVADYSHAIAEKVLQDIEPLRISYSQQDAGFEQMVDDIVLTLSMPPKVKICLDLLKKDKMFNTKSGGVVLADTAVKYMQKVHQICSGSVKDEDGNMHAFDSFKAEFIKQRFGAKKIAIFYKFKAEAVHLYNTFGADAITESPEQFAASDNLIFISQIQSGREGVNLSTADAIVMYNIDFSAVSYWQARARLQTKDRANSAKVYWLMTDGGIEHKIFEVVKEKKDYTLKHFISYEQRSNHTQPHHYPN